MPTLKFYILGAFFKVKFKATHKKLYFPQEFMEENWKTEKFWAVFNGKTEEFWKPAFSVTEEIEFSAMGVRCHHHFNQIWFDSPTFMLLFSKVSLMTQPIWGVSQLCYAMKSSSSSLSMSDIELMGLLGVLW